MPFPRSSDRHLPAVFTSVEARAAGLSDQVLRHARFDRPFHGVRRRSDLSGERVGDDRGGGAFGRHPESQLVDRATDYCPLLRPQETFSHTTALVLLGAPVRTDGALHVTIPAPAAPANRAGVNGHNHSRAIAPMPDRRSLPCMPWTEALIQAAPLLSLRELVVTIDHLICPRGPRGTVLVEQDELERAFSSSRARGARILRAAMRIARPGAESRMESLLHFELARLGLDDLEMQANLHDREGEWIGRFDLVCHRRRLIIEYDGEQHRTDRSQYLKDLRRLDRAREAGYRILRLHKEDFAPAELPATRRKLCDFLGAEPRRVPAELARYFAEV